MMGDNQDDRGIFEFGEARRRLKGYLGLLETVLVLASNWKQDFEGIKPDLGLSSLLDEFNRFSRSYLEFVSDAVDNAGRPLPPEKVNAVVQRLQEEWAVISHASTQHKTSEYAKWLIIADAFAREYYKHFTGYKISESPVVYFEKIYAIKRCIFSPVPIISMPLLYYSNPADWQALAHEIGHHIYWNSCETTRYPKVHWVLKNAVLRGLLQVSPYNQIEYGNYQETSKLVNMWLSWLEETFADLCATVIAGPAHVQSAMKRNDELAKDDLIRDDGEHPSPWVRPLIGIEALRWILECGTMNDPIIKENLTQLIQDLHQDWENDFKRRVQGLSHPTNGLSVADIEASVPTVVRAMLGDADNPTWWGNVYQSDNTDNNRSSALPESLLSMSDGLKSIIGEGYVPLGTLLQYEWWLKQLPSVPRYPLSEDEVNEMLPKLPNKRAKADEESQSFKDLYAQFRERITSELKENAEVSPEQIEWQVAAELISASLSEGRGDDGRWLTVISHDFGLTYWIPKPGEAGTVEFVTGTAPGPYKKVWN